MSNHFSKVGTLERKTGSYPMDHCKIHKQGRKLILVIVAYRSRTLKISQYLHYDYVR
jgi:hypothetical protein